MGFGELPFGINMGKSDSDSHSRTDNWTDEQKKVQSKLGNWLNTNMTSGSPSYGGARVAGMSSPESGAMGWLNTYMSQKAPQQYNWASGGLKQAMTGDYAPIVDDAATDQLYSRIKDQVLTRELPELQNTLAKNVNLSGMYFSGGHAGMQGDLLKDTQATLLDKLAELKYADEGTRRDVAREREARGFSAIPLAMQLGELEEQAPLRRAEAGLSLGSLPRELQQQKMDTQFAEFLRTLPENSPLLEQALAYLGVQGKSSTRGDQSTSNLGIG